MYNGNSEKGEVTPGWVFHENSGEGAESRLYLPYNT